MISETFGWAVYKRIVSSAVIHATLQTAFPGFRRKCVFVNISIGYNAKIILLEAGKEKNIVIMEEEALKFLEVLVQNVRFGTRERAGYLTLLGLWKGRA